MAHANARLNVHGERRGAVPLLGERSSQAMTAGRLCENTT